MALLELDTWSDELVMALLRDTRERYIRHFEPRLSTASEAWLEYLRLDRTRVLVSERTTLVNAKILAPARGTLFDNIRVRRARLLALFELSIECHTDITDRVQALLLHAVTGLAKPPMAEVTTFVSRPKSVSTPESSPVEPLRATHSERAGAALRRSAS